MFLGLCLHAHLPHVRHPEHARSLEERWLFEALWESYLPLLQVLRDLEPGETSRLTLSLSPTLLGMLGDAFLMRRFRAYGDDLVRFAERALARGDLGHLTPGIDAHVARLRAGLDLLDAIGGDVVGAFVAQQRRGVVELAVTAATHAILPNLGSPATIRGQIRIGRRVFEKLARSEPVGFWLPECAYDDRVGHELAQSGARFTVLDAHGVELARPTPPAGIARPIVSSGRVAYFGRDPSASHAVWSRQRGYPGHPLYRDFYRDLGFDLDEATLGDQLGPEGTRVASGLKPYAVSEGEDKRPYDPPRADALVREHALDFVRRVASAGYGEGDVAVVPFDAELFGHWWFEGPRFVEAVLAATGATGAVRSIGLGHYLASRREPLAVAAPATSTWGRGGHQAVWTDAGVAPFVRHLHHAERKVLAIDAVVRDTLAGPHQRAARIQAIRELFLAQSSDWAFMIAHGDTADYAEKRLVTHLENVERLTRIAHTRAPSDADRALLATFEANAPLFAALEEDDYANTFDPW